MKNSPADRGGLPGGGGAECGVAVGKEGIPARNTECLMCDFIFREGIYYSAAQPRAASISPCLRHTLVPADCIAEELDG